MQLSTESAFGIVTIVGGIVLIGISMAHAVVTRKIATRRRNSWEGLDRTKGATDHCLLRQ